MNAQIALILGQDGLTNGVVYALLALAIVLVFSITRVLFIPQGEFVAFGALTISFVQAGRPVSLVFLLVGLVFIEAFIDGWAMWRRVTRWRASVFIKPAAALALMVAMYRLPLADLPLVAQAALTLAVVVPLGPVFYRLFFQPVAGASVLVLLIVAIALHVALLGVGLLVFGPEGAKARPFVDAAWDIGPLHVQAQTLWVVAISLVLIAALSLMFGRTVYGKALRATAMNRTGARLMGISTELAGKASFLLATLIGGLSGIMISPITTIYYDSGFLIGLKGFVGAVIGGLGSYAIAAVGAVGVGLVESTAAFYASAYKDVIVFTLLIPFLLWRSMSSRHVEEEEE